jgi:hypothetical protein
MIIVYSKIYTSQIVQRFMKCADYGTYVRYKENRKTMYFDVVVEATILLQLAGITPLLLIHRYVPLIYSAVS